MSTILHCEPQHNPPSAIVFLTRQTVSRRLAVGKSFIYSAISEGLLPPPVRVGAARRWIEAEIDQIQHLIMRGASLDEQKVLVAQLVEARQLSDRSLSTVNVDSSSSGG